MIHKTKFFLALALVGVLTSFANAGNVALSFSVTERFSDDGNFTTLPFTWAPGQNIDDGAGIYQISLFQQTTSLLAGERGFANLSFDSAFSDASVNPGADYGPDPSQVDSNGGAPGGLVAKWATNVDAGAAGDYDGVLVSIPGGNLAGAVDPRQTLGSPDPEFFGDAFIRFTNAAGPHTWTLENMQFSIADSAGTFLSPQQGASLVVTFVGPGGPDDVIDPVLAPLVRNVDLNVEPDTIDNLQLTATDETTPVDGLVWSNLVYASGPGKNHPGSLNALMNSDGIFNWNPAGWKGGIHTFNATVADAAGNDVSGLALTVNLTVPEPATFGLAGLAMVGLVGLIRRRS